MTTTEKNDEQLDRLLVQSSEQLELMRTLIQTIAAGLGQEVEALKKKANGMMQ